MIRPTYIIISKKIVQWSSPMVFSPYFYLETILKIKYILNKNNPQEWRSFLKIYFIEIIFTSVNLCLLPLVFITLALE